MRRRAMSAAFVAGWRERLRHRADVLGAAFFLCLLTFVFGRLWLAVGRERGLPEGWSVSSLLLYFVAAELVLLAPGAVHQRVASDVRSGDLAVRLLLPVRWVEWELARAAGSACARLAVLAPTGIAFTALLHGMPPVEPRGVAVGLLLLGLAILLELAARLLIGVLAFWVEDSNAFYWIWQKVGFVLGGLMMPLDLYPAWLQAVARPLPFAAAIGGPARALARFDAATALEGLLLLAAWTTVGVAALFLVHARAARRVQLNGG